MVKYNHKHLFHHRKHASGKAAPVSKRSITWKLQPLLFGFMLLIPSARAFSPSSYISPSGRTAAIRTNPYYNVPTAGPVSLAQHYSGKSSPAWKQQQQTRVSTRLHVAAAAAAPAVATGICGSIATFVGRVIPFLHGDASFVLSVVLLLSSFGVMMERRTTIGKALSAPLSTMALALIVANVGIIPFESPIYTMVNQDLVPLAMPLLLFDSDLRRIVKESGLMLYAFCVGAVSTIVATLVAFPLVPMKALAGAGTGIHVACALAARHIGGAINFVAMAKILKIPGSTVSAAIAADNIVVAIYFAFLFYLAKPDNVADNSNLATNTTNEDSAVATIKADDNSQSDEVAIMPIDPENISSDEGNDSGDGITLSSIGTSLAVSSCLVTVGQYLTNFLFSTGQSSIPVTAVLTVIGATSFPKFFTRLRKTGMSIGILFMQLFFAASGASGSIALVIRSAPSLLLFSALQISIHFWVLMGLGRFVMKLPKKELYLASNANVGGPTTAAAMALSKNWNSLIIPALLVGTVGYATATFIGVLLVPILARLV